VASDFALSGGDGVDTPKTMSPGPHGMLPSLTRTKQREITMVYILTLLIFSGGNVAVATAEYNNSEACEAARVIDERALATAFRQPMLVATCTPKG
jgi:hypothetical protein